MNDKNDLFYDIVEDILMNEDFAKLKRYLHHGMDRYGHSLRVARISYEITRFLCLDYEKTARAALLHDFFLKDNLLLNTKDRIVTLFKHPDYALENAEEYFELSDLEKDIIVTHMFPIGRKIPRYLESWIVDLVDDVVSIYEKIYGIQKRMSFATSFLFILFMNRLK